MATRATKDQVRPEGPESGRLGQEAGRPAPVEPLRSIPRSLQQPGPAARSRTAPISIARGVVRTVGLFRKILLGDLTLWLVLTGVLTYEVIRNRMPPEHALFGAVLGLFVAVGVSIGLKQVANRVSRLNRSALEISRGDLSKPLATERTSFLGRDEVDELTTAIGNMQENLRELVGHIQGTSRSVADSADEMQESSANVSASAENIERSMARISEGAEHQLQLVERAHELIQKIAVSIQSSAQTATSAADTATATSTAAQAGGAGGPARRREDQEGLRRDRSGERDRLRLRREDAGDHQDRRRHHRRRAADQPARAERRHRSRAGRRVRPRIRGGRRRGAQAGGERGKVG